MKQRKIFNKKRKANIPLRRRLGIIYTRAMFVVKIALAILLYMFFFTKYLTPIKLEIAQNIYELTSDLGFTLKNVLIEGQHNVQETDILSTLNADKGTPVFALNLQEIKDNLKTNPWVRDVYIERRLPSTIYISLLERIPVAIWQINGQLFLIDEDGYKITDNIAQFSHLLHVVGLDANIYASKLIEDLAKYPELAKDVISAVRYGERRWNLNFGQDTVVKMPETGFDVALQYIAELQKKNHNFTQIYKTIDLRDASKYYIEKR